MKSITAVDPNYILIYLYSIYLSIFYISIPEHSRCPITGFQHVVSGRGVIIMNSLELVPKCQGESRCSSARPSGNVPLANPVFQVSKEDLKQICHKEPGWIT